MKGTLRFLVPDQITCFFTTHTQQRHFLNGIILWALGGEARISNPERPWFWIPASSIIPVHKVPNWWIKEINEIVTMYLQTAITMKCEALLNKNQFMKVSLNEQVLRFWKLPYFIFSWLFLFFWDFFEMSFKGGENIIRTTWWYLYHRFNYSKVIK